MREGTYGFGIVGCGFVGDVHARAIASMPNARVVAVVDGIVDRALRFGQRYECSVVKDLEELLSRSDVDIVSVCVPSYLHAEVGVRVADAGKALVVEKPIDVSLSAAKRLVATIERAGVAATVVSQARFASGMVQVRDLLEAGALGQLILGDARVKWYRDSTYYASAEWRGTWWGDGGGCLINQGVHSVDALCWLCGPVAEVSALCFDEAQATETEDVAVATLRFASGAVGSLVVTTAAFPGFAEQLEVVGTHGFVALEAGELITFETRARGHGRRLDCRGGRRGRSAGSSGGAASPEIGTDRHAAQLGDMVSALDESRPPAVSVESALHVLAVVRAIYESAKLGSRVNVQSVV